MPKLKSRKKTGLIAGFFIGIGWVVTMVFVALSWVAKAVFFLLSSIAGAASHGKAKDIARKVREHPKLFDFKLKRRQKRKEPTMPSGIRVLETIKGNFQTFWNKLYESDSMIGIVIGARGSGKSAAALRIAEELRGSKDKVFAMGFSGEDLPKWIKTIDDTNSIENDSLIIIDEGGILFSSRESMSNANKMLSELLFIARHKNLSIIFISQNSSNLEINTLRQADFLLLKKSSLLQKNFERRIISDIYEQHADKFAQYKRVRGVSLLYSDQFLGMTDNDLPSFWSVRVSKGFR